MEENEITPLIREDQILLELMQLKRLFTVMLGTEDLPAKEKFSRAAIIQGKSGCQDVAADVEYWCGNGK